MKNKAPDKVTIFGTEYFSAHHVVSIFNNSITQQSINKLALLGKIKAVKIGRTWYFTEQNLKRYLNGETA